MATSFSSRLANLREKKNATSQSNQTQLKLSLPDTEEKPVYQPSSNSNNTRTSFRLLKGRIEKNKSVEKQPDLKSGEVLTDPIKLTVNQPEQDLKLVIHDSPQIRQKKMVVQEAQQKKPTHKRILISKEPSKEENIPLATQEKKEIERGNKSKEKAKQEETYTNPHDEKPIIKEEEVEESKEPVQSENDLVICPEGCGRKFNRKALEKHAKACKLVFMSKRKQFNSEAKRITSKEQANIVRQNKIKEKSQLGKTKTKFDKTSDNWKAQSEDFRSAIKGIKKEDQEQEQNEEAPLATGICDYCDKKFANALLEKHLENCIKKKEKEEREKKKMGKKK